VGECRDFKFGEQVDHIQSQSVDNKLPQIRLWSRHVTNFKFLVPLKYKAKDFKSFTLVAHMKY